MCLLTGRTSSLSGNKVLSVRPVSQGPCCRRWVGSISTGAPAALAAAADFLQVLLHPCSDFPGQKHPHALSPFTTLCLYSSLTWQGKWVTNFIWYYVTAAKAFIHWRCHELAVLFVQFLHRSWILTLCFFKVRVIADVLLDGWIRMCGEKPLAIKGLRCWAGCDGTKLPCKGLLLFPIMLIWKALPGFVFQICTH